jgi:hypothetical protein
MHENTRCLSDDNNLVHGRNVYANGDVLPLFKTSESGNNNETSSPSQTNHNRDGSPENLPNENCSVLCGIGPTSSLDPQLSASASILTTATSNLDDATFEAQQRYWMAHSNTAFSHPNYNPILFPSTDWISNYSHQQTNSLLHHPQLQNESLMTPNQLNTNANFIPFYGLHATDTSHNSMFLIQSQTFQPVS